MGKRWFRFYEDAVDDPKVQRLPGELFKAWLNLLCICSRGESVMPPIADIAFTLRKTIPQVEAIIDQLHKRGLLDIVEGVVKPHNWDARQFKSDVSTERVKRFRQRFRNVSATSNETPPDTDTDTDTDTEKRKKDARARATPAQFGKFWDLYPHKIGKQEAKKKLDKALESVDFETLMDGLKRYAAKTDDRPWCNPATWLNQQRWLDQPALPLARGPPNGVNGHSSLKDQRRQEWNDATASLDEAIARRRAAARDGSSTPPDRLLSDRSRE